MLFVYKLLIIILLIIIFYLIINVNIECFSDKKNYTNINEYPMSRLIKSKLPYDLVVSNNKNVLYDFGNDEIDGKLSELLNINNDKIIKNIDGIDWGNWIYNNNISYAIWKKLVRFFICKYSICNLCCRDFLL